MVRAKISDADPERPQRTAVTHDDSRIGNHNTEEDLGFHADRERIVSRNHYRAGRAISDYSAAPGKLQGAREDLRCGCGAAVHEQEEFACDRVGTAALRNESGGLVTLAK